MDALDLGMRPERSYDCTPVYDLVSSSGGCITFGPGVWYFQTPPQIMTAPMKIEGAGVGATTLARTYKGSKYTDALFNTTSKLVMRDLSIWTMDGSNGGSAIRLDGRWSSASRLDNLYITSPDKSMWDITLTIMSADPGMGIRDVHCTALELFAAGYSKDMHVLWGINLRGCSFQNVQCYPAGSARLTGHATLQGTGVGGYCQGVNWTTTHLTELNLYQTTGMIFDSAVGTKVNVGAGCANVRGRY